MKDSVKTFLIIALAFFSILLFASCEKETIHQTPCNGNCGTNYIVVYENQEIYPNSNGYYEVPWNGLEYFQVKGQLTEVNNDYVINDVPQVEAKFDSDYWVVINNLYFQTPQYSYLGWFNSTNLNRPIAFGNHTYTMNDIISLHSPLNVVGYQVPKHFCTDCPYSESLVGTYSKYNYNPTCNVLLDDEMVGDTINIFVETTFNPEGGVWYHGHNSPTPKETVENQLKIIII
jgi:hypothetical protein